jgi:hypothetical protein
MWSISFIRWRNRLHLVKGGILTTLAIYHRQFQLGFCYMQSTTSRNYFKFLKCSCEIVSSLGTRIAYS